MSVGVPVAYLQLKKYPRRLVIAVAGMAVCALGILCQMGFEDSLFRSATRLFQELDADIVVISPQYQFMVLPAEFSERRLFQLLAVEGVTSFSTVRLGVAPFKNPVTHINRNVYVVGASKQSPVFANPDWQRKLDALRAPEQILFDSRSRTEFGPIGALFGAGPLRTEIANQSVQVSALFEMGASFSADGTAITSVEGFQRLFPQRRAGLVDIGLVHVAARADVDAVLARIRAVLPDDVVAMTHQALNEREQKYWRGTTPAGFIFKTVLVVSLLVGCVSVYQILSSDIAENLKQYATLKAMGYPDRYFLRLTFEKAWLLTSLSYPVGFLLAAAVYVAATYMTLVPLVMTSLRAVGVYFLILGAACAAGVIATKRLRHTDLSELF